MFLLLFLLLLLHQSTWSASCYPDNTGYTRTETDGSLSVHIIASGEKKSPSCYDHYALLTNTGLKTVKVEEEGDTTFTWTLPADITEAESWDLATKGVRLMEVMTPIDTTAANLIETVGLFAAEFTKHVPQHAAERNVDFMNLYPQMKMEPRDPLSSTPPPAKLVHSGDFFGVIRLDGLDPMLVSYIRKQLYAFLHSRHKTTQVKCVSISVICCSLTVRPGAWAPPLDTPRWLSGSMANCSSARAQWMTLIGQQMVFRRHLMKHG